jgi:hypothetical protein
VAASVRLTRDLVTRERIFSVYGLRVATELRFETTLLEARGDPDLNLRRVRPLLPGELEAFSHAYSSTYVDQEGIPIFDLFIDAERELLRFRNRADFLFDGSDVLVWPVGDGGAWDVETLFLSSVLAYWLERSGVLAIHASAVVIDGEATAFLAPSGGGKSSLAATFLFGGQSILTDDILALRIGSSGVEAAPAFPEIRLQPDVGRHHLGERFDRFRRFHPAADKRCVPIGGDGLPFCTIAKPLRALFVVRRMDSGTNRGLETHPMSRRDAFIELVRSTYTPTLVEAVGLAPSRLERIARLVELVPAWRLTVADDPGDLPRVAELVRTRLEIGR